MKITHQHIKIQFIIKYNQVYLFQTMLSSFIETTEQATTDMQDINKKILSQLKTYTFFIFYDLQQKDQKIPTILQVSLGQSLKQKMNFTLNNEKDHISQVEESNVQVKKRQVSLNFYNINSHNDILHGISDVRMHSGEHKVKLIINASEQKLMQLIQQFDTMNVDLSAIPIIVNSTMFQSDLNAFLGWKRQCSNDQQIMMMGSLNVYQLLAEQWIKSSTEKIDLWQVEVIVGKDNGHILKLVNNKLTALPYDKKSITQYFLSHFCIGHHASLLMNCQQKLTTNENTIGNNFITMIERLKKFCCISDKNMKSTTGIVNITLIDDKGDEIEIMKHLRNNSDLGGQEQSQSDFNKSTKYKQYKDVVSILLANIGVYQNSQLQNSIEGKINDGKIELLTYDSQKSHRKVCSAQGVIKLKMQAESVDVQIGEGFYRLENPVEIRISLSKKLKVGFHHRMVKC